MRVEGRNGRRGGEGREEGGREEREKERRRGEEERNKNKRIKCCFGKKVREYFAYPRGKVLVSKQKENKTEHLGRKIQYGRKTCCYKNSWVVIGNVVVLVCLLL